MAEFCRPRGVCGLETSFLTRGAVMKTRESGMPDESLWESFFDVATVLSALQLVPEVGNVAEFGCGYGTFTIPAVRRCRGILAAFDIDPDMVAATSAKAKAAVLTNVRTELRDFVVHGTGLPASSVDYVMMFNILHAEESDRLLAEARRILAPRGKLGVMHWNYDPATPRGPSMAVRPRPERLRREIVAAGFTQLTDLIDLPPYHYGFVFERPEQQTR